MIDVNIVAKRVIDEIIEREGGEKYTNDPSDSGGATRFGISERVAHANGYSGDMKTFPRPWAERIYRAMFWDAVNADKLYVLSSRICEEVVDTGVHSGPLRAGEFLQRSLNVLSGEIGKELFPALKIDGDIGNKTINALRLYLAHRPGDEDELVLLTALNSLQGAYLIDLAEKRLKDRKWIFGWLRARVRL